MSYGRVEAAKALRAIRSGEADPDAQAELEFFLLDQLQELGEAAFGQFLINLPNLAFEPDPNEASGPSQRYADASATPALCVAFSYPANPESIDALTFINVELISSDEPEVQQKPEHVAFYDTWESVGLLESTPAKSRPWERAVFLVGLLEAELMNGGFGQYLTNSEGRYLSETLAHLEQMGASLTSSLLQRAIAVAPSAESYAEAWDLHSESFDALDAELLANQEDLAALCYAHYNPESTRANTSTG